MATKSTNSWRDLRHIVDYDIDDITKFKIYKLTVSTMQYGVSTTYWQPNGCVAYASFRMFPTHHRVELWSTINAYRNWLWFLDFEFKNTYF